MKTLAEFKRDAANGRIKLEVLERYGKSGDEIPERLRGIRTISRVNTVAVFLANDRGEESELLFDSAKLVEYDGESLIIYSRGERDLTSQEREILADWQRTEDDYYRRNPYGESYWIKKDYFKDCPCPWLSGFGEVRGKRYNLNGKVIDTQVKGNAILKYRVYSNESKKCRGE